MNLSKVAIIICYIGPFPTSFEVWLKSCEYNPSIDFLIFTDQAYSSDISNVYIHYMDLKLLNKLLRTKLSLDYLITFPYKICDFRPSYGLIFNEYLNAYDFWGHCDIDMIFGDIRSFVTEKVLMNHEKIYSLGHLSLYRNCDSTNELLFYDGDRTMKDVINTKELIAFDERFGIYKIYISNNIPIYDEFDFADISIKYTRFTITTVYYKYKNYKLQIFRWESGKVYRYYIDGDLKREEFVYIHYKERKFNLPDFDVQSTDSFYITPYGYIKDDCDIREAIFKYNPYKGILLESHEYIRYRLKVFFKKVNRKLRKLLN